MYSIYFRFGPWLASATLVLGMGGCGQQKNGDVTGRVTYNGSPLAKQNGKIVFVGPEGTQVEASIGLDGTYTATKIPTGLNRVAVYYLNSQVLQGKQFPVRSKEGKATAPPTPGPVFLTPSKYATVDTSTLSVLVEKGTIFNPNLTGPRLP